MYDSLGHALGEGILLLFLLWVLIIDLPTSPVFLWLGLKAVKSPQQGFWRIILTAVFNFLIAITIIGIFIQPAIIKYRHKVGWGKALLVWLLGGVLPLILAVIVFLLM